MPRKDHAACAGTADPDAFFPDPQDWATPRPWAALMLCAVCAVTAGCLAAGYRGREHGIWGGTTEQDRDLLRLQGWEPGRPLPRPQRIAWATVAEAARALRLSTRVIHLWASHREIDFRSGRAPTGQPCRLVRLDQVAARAARARLPQRHPPATTSAAEAPAA